MQMRSKWVCSNCGGEIPDDVVKDRECCPHCRKPYPYSVTLLDAVALQFKDFR